MTPTHLPDAAHVHVSSDGPSSNPSFAALVVRNTYLPMMLIGVNGAIVLLAARGQAFYVLPLLMFAVLLSFAAERILPYRGDWNTPCNDTGRDAAHAFVNELVNLAAVALLPFLTPWLTVADIWPHQWPFMLQVAVAIVVLDIGITLTHFVSHKVGALWRFHAVHHSVKRFYGFNGLMKHPVHQLIELTAGVAPLVLVGLPLGVATALAACVAVQLLLQHSNVDYRTGPVGWLFALNRTHRFHHLKWPGIGDVNFGLFLTVWDRMLGTHVTGPRGFTSDDLGIAAEPNYPTRYVGQLLRPFRTPRAAALVALSLCMLVLPSLAIAAPAPTVSDGPNANEATAQVEVAVGPERVYAALANVGQWSKLFSDVARTNIVSRTDSTAVADVESRLIGHAHRFSFAFRAPQTVRLVQADQSHGSKLWMHFQIEPAGTGQRAKVKGTLHYEVGGFWGFFVSDGKLRSLRRQKLLQDLSDLVAIFGSQ